MHYTHVGQTMRGLKCLPGFLPSAGCFQFATSQQDFLPLKMEGAPARTPFRLSARQVDGGGSRVGPSAQFCVGAVMVPLGPRLGLEVQVTCDSVNCCLLSTAAALLSHQRVQVRGATLSMCPPTPLPTFLGSQQ